MLCGVCSIWIWQHAHSNPSILREEPSGMLSYAGILHNSVLHNVASDVCTLGTYDGKFVRQAKRRWNFDDAVCSVVEDGTRAVVQVENLTQRKSLLRDESVGQ